MKQYRRNHPFTLVELMVAMTVLVILSLVLFNILGRAREAWSAMETNTRIYENARIALDLIARDLQSAVASSETGREIPFYVGTDSPSGSGSDINRFMLSFVAASSRMGGATSRLTKIAYTYDDNQLKRRLLQDHNNNWDFYGKTDNSWVASSGGAGFQRVIDGVEEVRFICLDSAGNQIDFEETLTALPATVWVSITLFDPRLKDTPTVVRDRTRRTFTKMVYLRTQGF